MQFDPSLFAALLPKLYAVVILVIADVLVGALAAVKAKEFDWEKFPGFLQDYGLKIFGWLVFESLALLPADLLGIGGIDPVIATIAYGALVAGALGSILKNALFLFPVANDALAPVGVPEREPQE
jgi:hypothetical protein